MRKSAMQNIHDMNQRGLTTYANHQLQSLQNQFGTGQGSVNKKPQQTTLNTGTSGNKKVSSLWDELNEGKSKPESGNFESSNVIYIKNPPVSTQQTVQPQNLQLEQALKQIQDLEQALVQARQVNQEQSNVIENKNNTIMELQGKLLDKTEQITAETNKYNIEHNKLVDIKYKVDVVKVKLDNFINNHQDIEDQGQLVEMLGDLQIADNE